MNEQAFELTSLAMRYWFAFLMLLAVLCALRLAILDHRRTRRERLAAPNLEYVGELLVVKGAGEVARGERYAIQRDIVIGRRRKCDVCLKEHSVFPRHARGELRAGGMLIGAIGGAPVSLRGQPLQQEILVTDGALFCIGAITLQLTLYDVAVEYEVDGEGRAIDAARSGGDEFDDEYAPFEHDFDGEYGDGSDDGADVDYQYDADGPFEPDPETPARSAPGRAKSAQGNAKRDSRREFDPPTVAANDLPDYDPDEYDDEYENAPVRRRGQRS